MTKVVHRARIAAGITTLALITQGHVGTLDAFFRGNAGPYPVQVTVRPPGVVPGLAMIIVRVERGDVESVTTQAAVWNLGSRGAPAPDAAVRSPGDPALWTSELWLMTRGSYAINVSLSGTQGTGRILVPFTSVATRQLRLSGSLGWALGLLGMFLIFGLVSIVGSAARESTLPAGAATGARENRHGRLGIIYGAVIIGFALAGGRNWWRAVDAAYGRSLFRPMESAATVTTPADESRRFGLVITDSAYVHGRRTPIIPDHGKPMHLFLVREESFDAFGHLHPEQRDSVTFIGPVSSLPAGTYRYYADVVHESGYAQTLTGKVAIPSAKGNAPTGDPDDAVFMAAPATDSVAGVDGGLTVTFSRPSPLTASADLLLRFEIRDSSGTVATLEPYMGMPGHAMVARRDGEVFAHLHSNGSFSLAAQDALAAIERGDTIGSWRPNTPRPRLSSRAHTPGHAVEPTAAGELAFPFAFPSPGDYVVWVQFRHAGTVQTAAFALTVAG